MKQTDSYFLVQTGTLAGTTWIVDTRRPVFVIGSDRRCDLHLADPNVAPVHAVVGQKRGAYLVKPRDASTCVLINGRRIDGMARLRPGDAVRIGGMTLYFQQVTGETASFELAVQSSQQAVRRFPCKPEKTINVTGIVALLLSVAVLLALVGYAIVDQINKAPVPDGFETFTPGTVSMVFFYADW